MIRHQKLIFFCLPETLLDLGIAPVSTSVQNFEIYDIQCLSKRDDFDTRLVRYIGREHDPLYAEDVWMNLKVNSIGYASILTGDIFHWVVRPETKMDIPI